MVIVQKRDVSKIIQKGGSISSDNLEKEFSYVNLRMPKTLFDNIDDVVKDRIGLSRNAWILEAIQEKIKKENI